MSTVRRHDRGQAATEMALSTVFLLLIVAGVVDMARLYYDRIDLIGAAREGARHGIWFDTPNRRNPYLDDSDIISAVNLQLQGAGLPTVSANQSQVNGNCPTPSDNNSFDNPPFAASYYPTTLNQPWLYLCYNPPSNPGCTLPAGPQPTVATAPTNNCWRLGDLNVILLLKSPVVTPSMANVVGPSVLVAASAHMEIQGKP